jgi:hypothetical protein
MKSDSKTKTPVSSKKTKPQFDDFQSTDFTSESSETIGVRKTATKVVSKKYVTKKVAKKAVADQETLSTPSDEVSKAPSFKPSASYDLNNFPQKKKEKKTADDSTEKKPRAGRRIRDLAMGPIDHSGETSKYAMEIKTDQGGTIRKVFDNISSLLKTVDIRFYPQGIYICASDLAKYTLISVSLIAEQFLKYYCPNRIKITLDINALNSALGNAQNLETLSFIFREKDARTLLLVLETKNKKKNVIKLFGTTSENKTFRVPKQQFENPMVFKASEFQSDIRSMCSYSPLVTFVTNYKEFHILASGDQGSSHLKMYPESKESVERLRKNMGLSDVKAAVDPNSLDSIPAVQVDENDNNNVNDNLDDNENSSQIDNNVQGSEDDAIPIAESNNSDEKRVNDNIEKGEELAKKIPSHIEKYFVEDDQVPEEDVFDKPQPIVAPVQTNPEEVDPEMDDLDEKFDESYVSGLYILRYFHTICKNTNLGEYVEIMLRNGEYVTLRYPIETLGYLTFSVLQCIQ